MRRFLLTLLLSGFAATSAFAQNLPPCNAGIHPALGEKILPLQNGLITYCISDFGWSDTWLLGTPATYNVQEDVLSGDDAFNLKYIIPTGGLGPGSGWISPSIDEGTLSAQDAPGWAARALWHVVTAVHSTGPNSTESVIANTDGLQITIDALAPPGALGVQITLIILNTTSTRTFTGLRLTDYFNFHPNGSNFPNNRLGTTVFSGNCLITTGEPTVKLNATLCGLFAPTQHEVGLAYATGTPAVWQDVTSDNYNGSSGPVGPDDSAGALVWTLPDLPPGASTQFAVGKNVTPVGPPTISKVFNPAVIRIAGLSSLSFTVANLNASQLTGIGFSDTLPTGIAVATPNGLTGSCGGGTINASGVSVTLANAVLPGSTSCTFSINVIGNVAGAYTNTTSNVTSVEGGNGNTASAVLTVVPPPIITKSFSPKVVVQNSNLTLTFTIRNPGALVPLTGVGFTDPMPTGLVVAATPGATNTCGGTLSGFTAGSTSVTLSGAVIAAGATCTITVNVTANGSIGGLNNTTNIVSSTEGGPGNFATDSLVIIGPPSISKAFNPTTIKVGKNSLLSFVLTNPDPVQLTLVGFNDPLPDGLEVAPVPNVSITCSQAPGAVSPAPGDKSLILLGITMPANSTCSVSLAVIGKTTGVKVNTTTPVTSLEAGNGNSASATLTVTAILPPAITKTFTPAQILVGATSVLTIGVTNPNTDTALTNVRFNDTFPAGIAVAATPALSNSCGGTLTGATAGSTALSLTGSTLAASPAASASCIITVTVTGPAPGAFLNSAGPVASDEAAGNTASATLTVVGPPVITKGFNPAQVNTGATSTLRFAIQNTNTSVSLTGVGFTDNFPPGVAVAATPGLNNGCGGTLTGATANSTSIALTGVTLAANATCNITLTVIGLTPGTKNNVTSAVTSAEGGPGNTATAQLMVVTPPALFNKVFVPAQIPLQQVSVLTFTVTPPSIALTSVAFSDSLPIGLQVAALPGVVNNCGGILTGFAAGSTVISLTGGAAPATGCTISVNVTGITAGTKVNTSSPLTATEVAPTSPATAALVVVAPPVISKAFDGTTISVNQTSTLTVTINNPNGAPNPITLTGVGFTDNFPPGVAIASPSTGSNTCGGTLTGATAGSTSIVLTGGILPGGTSCAVVVTVIGSTEGTKNNNTSVVTSLEGGPGNAGSASLVVTAPPALSYLLTYLANLDRGDSFLDITNTGATGASLPYGTTASITGSLCANVYVFSPDEQLVSCCSCPVTPNGLVSLSANLDLLSNTLTPTNPTSVVVKIVPTLPIANSCVNSAAALDRASVGTGIEAFSTTLHQTPTGTYTPTERRFSPAILSPGELMRLNSLCNLNIANGSGFGVCRACRLGGLGATQK